MNRNSTIALAVATVLGTISTGAHAVPTLSDAAGAPHKLYVAGSSAAKAGATSAILVNLCGGASNALVITGSPNGNFEAIACVPASGTAGSNGSDVFTVYYRFEGGSVTGVLPIANNVSINQLDLSQASLISCATLTCTATVNGVSTGNGTDDSFSGAVAKLPVQLGISDVEPGALIGNNYPSAYVTSAWGAVNPTGVQGVASSPLFDEVYGIYVNNTGAGMPSSLSLSTQMVQNILIKKVSNWSQVTDTSGNQVTSSSVPIVIVNRETGSGSRAATDLLIAGDSCQAQGKPIKEASATATDWFSTGDVLGALNTTVGGISYATIDNAPKANEILISLNSVAPTNLAAAEGSYPFWVESVYTTNPNSAGDSGLTTFFENTLKAISTLPHIADVLANPNAGNTAHVTVSNSSDTATGTLSGLGTTVLYVNPFTRSKVTCNIPSQVAATN